MTGNAEKGDRWCWIRWRMAGWIAGVFLLLLALVAKQFMGEVNLVDNIAQTGAMLIGVGIAIEVASRKTSKSTYRAAVGLALGSGLLLGWVNGAVGIIGSADNQANLMYGGVLVVGATGAVIARFQPKGMARALFAAALAQTLVAVIALVGGMGSGPLDIVTINGFFVSLFVGSAVLFSKAARDRTDRCTVQGIVTDSILKEVKRDMPGIEAHPPDDN
ncbi:MAG: hypothetical protein OSA81_12455 [Longimicrobiales bacterium]|nr:hypothetical protein [Longimicrobiales bacterium]